MDGITDKRTAKDKLVSIIKRLIDTNGKPYMLAVKRATGISSAQAWQTKSSIELLSQLTPEEILELSTMTHINHRGETIYFKPYIDKFEQLNTTQKSKADIKSISANKDQYAILIAAIKVKTEDFLLEQEAKIKVDIIESRNHIQERYRSMDKKAFQEFYGEKQYYHKPDGSKNTENYYISLSKFYVSRYGILLQLSDARLPEFILKAQKAYRNKEYSKIDGLVYKLKTKYPNLSNFIMTNYRKGIDGIEFTLTADSPEGSVSIFTQTIYAGGYNIQRLHLRWLMHVTGAKGNKIKITQG